MADNSRSFVAANSDKISVASPTGVLANDAWTFGVWAKQSTTAGDGRVILRVGSIGATTRGFMLHTNAADELAVRVGGESVGPAATALGTGTWKAIGVTNSNSGVSTVTIGVDGTQVATGAVDPATELQSGDVFQLSDTNPATSAVHWNGAMAWAFWLQGVELTHAEILAYLNDPESLVTDYGPDGAETADALKVLWPMQCSNGSTETDKSGVGNNGTITGATLGSADGPSPTTDWTDVCSVGGGTNATVTPTGFGLSMSLGTPTALRSGVRMNPTGFGLAATLGSPSIATNANKTASPTGFGLTTSLGAPTVTKSGVRVSPSGFGLTTTLGSFTTRNDTTLTGLTGFGLTASLGAPTVTHASSPTVTPTGFGLSMSLGAPAVIRSGKATPSGFGLALTLGAPTPLLAVALAPTGFGLSLSLGSPTISNVIVVARRIRGPTYSATVGMQATTTSAATSLTTGLATSSARTSLTVGAPTTTATIP